MKRSFCHQFLLLLTTLQLSAAWNYSVLHQFERPGGNSIAPLVLHTDNSLYGTMTQGGAFGFGTIFRVVGGEVETLVHLSDSTGRGPRAGLVSGSDGNLYGTCGAGGANQFGTFFKVSSAGVFTKMFDFTGIGGSKPGSVPGALVLHPNGNFYGTTAAGGSEGFGTIFRVTPAGVHSVLANFSGQTGTRKGIEPRGKLAISGNNLYGLTRFGGANNLGTAFRITTAGTFTSFFEFTGTNGNRPGANPAGGLMLHSSGSLYGLAEYGGRGLYGTAFRLSTGNVFSLLHQFSDPTGSQPVGELVEGSDGLLYGAAAAGGTSGFGGLFRLTTTGTHTLQTSFEGLNGAVPQAGLTREASGSLVGVTSAGGAGQLGVVYRKGIDASFNVVAGLSPQLGWHPSGAPLAIGSNRFAFPVAFGGQLGGGTIAVWSESQSSLTASAISPTVGAQPDGRLTSFQGTFWGLASTGGTTNKGSTFSFSPTNGISLQTAHQAPGGSLAEGSLTAVSGALYGVAREGGASGRGTIFQLDATGNRSTVLSFTGVSGLFPGRAPRGPLVLANNGSLYGMTELGGAENLGVIFKLTLPSTYTVVAEFVSNGPHSPRGGFVKVGNLLYGATSAGSSGNRGGFIRLNPTNDTWSLVASFPIEGSQPEGELLAAGDGAILGFATQGGSENKGGIFRYHPTSGLQIISQLTGSNGAALSGNSSGQQFTGGLVETAPNQFLGVAAGGGDLSGGVLFRLRETTASLLSIWKDTHLVGFDNGDLADPDKDGLVNLLEYALGSNPIQSDPVVLPRGEIVNGRFQLTLPRNPARNDVSYFVEASSSLSGSWTVIASSINGSAFIGPGYFSGETPGSGLKAVTIRNPSTVASATRTFFRIRVEANPL